MWVSSGRQLHVTFYLQWTRSTSILAWGRNKEGQCGTVGQAVLLQPAEVPVGHGTPTLLAAGRQHSAALSDSGSVYTWGSGQAGKLGLSTTHNVQQPTRVEAFVGRTEIKSLALGHQHTLFLDTSGTVWGCGENKEGQCGLGTSLETIAGQRRLAWTAGVAAHQAQMRLEDANGQVQASRSKSEGDDTGNSPWPTVQPLAHNAPHMQHTSGPFGAQQERMLELQQAQRLQTDRASTGEWARAWAIEGLMPGQLHTPTRLGRDLRCSVNAAVPAGVEQPPVSVHVAASRFFSACIDSTAQVWTWGGGYNGELGHSAAWTPTAKRVGGEVHQVLEDNGGAVDIVAGTTFCMCRTGSGRAVVWGGWQGAGPLGATSRVAVAEVMGLPPVLHIAAGHGHALMSDGNRVWALGQWLSADGSRKAGPGWSQGPQEVLGPVPGGIAALASGSHSCAAITGSGQVYLWGCLLCKDQADYLEDDCRPQTSLAQHLQNWDWPGMGADAPTLVPGLEGVHALAMGSMHAMALVRS